MRQDIFMVLYGMIAGGLIVIIWYEATAFAKEQTDKIKEVLRPDLDKVKEVEVKSPKQPRAKRPYKCQTCNGSEYYTYGKTRKIRVCRSCWDSSKEARNAYAKKYYKKHKTQVAARMRERYQKSKGK